LKGRGPIGHQSGHKKFAQSQLRQRSANARRLLAHAPEFETNIVAGVFTNGPNGYFRVRLVPIPPRAPRFGAASRNFERLATQVTFTGYD